MPNQLNVKDSKWSYRLIRYKKSAIMKGEIYSTALRLVFTKNQLDNFV